MLNPDEALPIESLFSNLPEGQWEPRASGNQINPDVARELELLWADHVKALVKTSRPDPASPLGIGQGRLLDAKLRKEIEDLAQRRLMEHYERDGWQVEDRRHGNPYDARATKQGTMLYLEAKGTVTLGDRVIVTRGEVDWARDHPGQCVLGVLSGITLRKDGSIRRRSGTLRLFEWNPDDDSLVALTYDHYPDADHELALE